MEAFVYCWTDRKTGMLYVGSHKGHPGDGYVCSSKWMKEQYAQRPGDFTRQIIAEGELDDIKKLETKILLSVDAARHKDFYNKHNTVGRYYLKAHTESAKKKIGAANKGRSRPDLAARNRLGHSDETKQKIGNRYYPKGSAHPKFGSSLSDGHKKKISDTKLTRGCPAKTPEHLEKIRAKAKQPKSLETRQKMSEAAKAREAKKKALII